MVEVPLVFNNELDNASLSSSLSSSEGDVYKSDVVEILRGVLTGVFCFVFVCSVIGTIVGIRVKRPLRVVITIIIDLICILRCVLEQVHWFRKEGQDKLAIEYSLICDLLFLIMAIILIIHVTIQERKDEKIKVMVKSENRLSLKRYLNITDDNDEIDNDDNMLYNFKRDSDFCCCSNNIIAPFVCIVIMGVILLVCTIFDTYGFVTEDLVYIDKVCGFRTLVVGYAVFLVSIACFVLSIIYRNGSNRFALVCLMCFVKGILTLAAFFVTANYEDIRGHDEVSRYERVWIEWVYALVSEAVPIMGLLIAFLGIDMYNSSKEAQKIDYTSALFYVGDE